MKSIQIFKNRDFSLLFFGRLITNIGDSIYAITAMWLVYDLTKDSFYTGIASSLIFMPQLLSFLFGPIVDRLPLKLILVFTQIIECLFVLLIPITFFLDVLNVWLVILGMFFASIMAQIAYPAQTSALPKILNKDELIIGNSFMTFSYQGIDFVLTALSGLLIIYIGAINLYLIDAVTFILAASLFFNVKMEKKQKNIEVVISKISERDVSPPQNSYIRDLLEGLKFVKNSFIPKFLIPVIIANGLFGMISAILPAYSIMKGGDAFYGYFMAAWSIGMLIGSISASFLKKFPIGKIMIISTFISSIVWAGSFFINAMWSVILFGIANISLGIINVLINSMFQSLIPENLLGRVFAVISSIAGIALPLGAILGGYLGRIISSENVFICGAIGLLFVSLYWLLYPTLRALPAYLNMEKQKYINL
jgi:MFS family permease